MTDFLGAFPTASAVSSTGARSAVSALPLLVGFLCYQFILCFANTNIFMVSNALVTTTEAILLIVLAWRALPSCKLNEIAGLLLLVFYFMLLWAMRGDIDPAGPRNIFLIFFSYALGRSMPDRRAANKALWILSAIVLFWAAVEYLANSAYLHYFNILKYYIARGAVSENVRSWVKQDTYVSGLRQSGRNLFPMLGNLRVSSVFLEPVSMGNYATIVGLWALSFGGEEKREALKHFLVCLILIVACDSRFASILVLFLLALRFMPMLQNRFFVLILPLVVVGGLIGLTSMGMGSANQDNLGGRLMHSGLAILDLSFLQLLGMGKLDYLGDMGIAYALEYFGLFLCLLLWLFFAAPRLKDGRTSRYRLMMAVYCLGILSVSGTSFYSAKTSVIGWFLYGVLRAPKVGAPVLKEGGRAVT